MDIVFDIRNGNEKSFEQAYRQYHEKLYFFFLKKTRSDDVSTELVQETFIKLWRFREGLSTDIDLSIQIFRIARTTLVDVLRKHARQNERFVPLTELLLHQPADVPAESPGYYLDKIRQPIEQLTGAQKKIIEYKLNGYSNKEIAALLSISAKTVENQVNKAYQSIRAQVDIPFFLLLIVLQYQLL